LVRVTPRVLVVQHEDDDPIHRMGEWMAVDLDVRRPYVADDLPTSLQGYAALVVMGGAMGANDDATSPWLPATKELIREAAADGVPTLGICLGHQLATVALGGEVLPNPAGRQFGLYDVNWEPAAHLDRLFSTVATPRRGAHWNDDIVTRLPEGAVLMARSSSGEVQAARHAPTVWGVQWHPEVDEPLFRGWLVDGDADPALAAATLSDLASSDGELEQAWRPLASRFVELAAARQPV
jgi:GMP synthase (glutamine-hydrolysing)